MRKLIAQIAACAVLLRAARAYAGSPLDGTVFASAHRVVVLGDSITYSGQYVDDIEAVLRLDHSFEGLELLDLGLPSETVSGLSEPGHAGGKFLRPDLHERLERVLQKTKPDVVIACYGMNDGIYYPFAEERFKKFRDGIQWLHERVTAAGARIIHVTPPVFDPAPIKSKTLPAGLNEYRKPYEGYNDVLDRYSAWLVSQRTNGWTVIDLHTPMNSFLAERRRTEPGFSLTRDGVHDDDLGHWLMAREILDGLSLQSGRLHFENLADITNTSSGAEMLKLIHQKNRMLSDAWLTDTGHKRPGMKQGLPVPEAQSKAAGLLPTIESETVAFLQKTGETTKLAAPSGLKAVGP